MPVGREAPLPSASSTAWATDQTAAGWMRETAKDEANFLAIAQGQSDRAETPATLCEELGWFPDYETRRLRGLLDEVSRMPTAMPPDPARVMP